MSQFMYFAVCLVWGNLALQLYVLASLGASPWRVFLLVVGVLCVVSTSVSAILSVKG